MNFSKSPLVLLAAVSICLSQAVNITGVVKDGSSNAAIKGAIVKLLHTSYVNPDTTNAAGAFGLVGQPTLVRNQLSMETGYAAPTLSASGAILFTLSSKENVTVKTYSVNGNLISSQHGMRAPGSYSIAPCQSTAGFYLTQVTIGSSAYSLKQANVGTGIAIMQSSINKGQALISLAKQAAFPDTISVTCSGYSSTKTPVTNPVASNLSISMTKQNGPAGMKLISANGKSFQMGDATIAPNVHTCTFNHDFWMDSTEVTQEDYLAVMGTNPSLFTGNLKRPVENIDFIDAFLYCNKRSKRDGYDTAYRFIHLSKDFTFDLYVNLTGNVGYRLPTESEWEYACRAGTTSTFFWGTGMRANYSWTANDGTTHPVATKLPNNFGLYDMAGNVAEFCNDSLDHSVPNYSSAPSTDYNMPEWHIDANHSSNQHRMARGGSWTGGIVGAWHDPYFGCASAERNHFWFDQKGNEFGFRCVLTAR